MSRFSQLGRPTVIVLFAVASMAPWEIAVAQDRLPFDAEDAASIERCGCVEQGCVEQGCVEQGCGAYGCADNGCCRGRRTLFSWNNGRVVSDGSFLDEPLVTDRPDFTEASGTVGNGVSQIEMGYTYVYNSDLGESTRFNSFGEALLRQGMFADWFEFRLAVFPVEEQTTAGGVSNSTAGIGDLYLGVKLGLTLQDGALPEMALIPQMNVPTGSNAFTSNHVEPGLNWIYSWEINDFLSTAGSTQGNKRVDDTGDAYTEIAQSWTFAYTLTDELGAYTEWFALFPSGANTAQVEHFFNGGFTYLISDNMQFDIRAGKGLNYAAPDYFFGTGLSVRFP